MYCLSLPRFHVVPWLIIILFYFTTDFISLREIIFLWREGSLLNNINNTAIRCTEERSGLIGIYHWNCKSIYIIVMGYAHEMHMKCECM